MSRPRRKIRENIFKLPVHSDLGLPDWDPSPRTHYSFDVCLCPTLLCTDSPVWSLPILCSSLVTPLAMKPRERTSLPLPEINKSLVRWVWAWGRLSLNGLSEIRIHLIFFTSFFMPLCFREESLLHPTRMAQLINATFTEWLLCARYH